MTRQAVLVANSVSYTDLSKNVTAASLGRTIERLSALLSGLEPQHAFHVTACVDRPSRVVLSTLEERAAEAAADDELLLLYYFGHGELNADLSLHLIVPNKAGNGVDRVPLEVLESRVRESGVAQSLFLLDCCYSGAIKRAFGFNLKGDHCRIASTIPAQKAFVVYDNLESPIGAFTRAFMDAFTDAAACNSSTDDDVSADSLFRYLKSALAASDPDRKLQSPTMVGSLPVPLFRYHDAPTLRPGFSRDANEKSSYSKIVALCRAMSRRAFSSVRGLHAYVIEAFRECFETLFKRQDGSFGYKPVQEEVIARYLRLMERLGLVAVGEDIRLLAPGKELATHYEARCNEILLRQIDGYLARHGASQQLFVEATRRVLQGRRIPTQQEVADRLVSMRVRIPKSDVGILLDLLGYAGVLQLAGRRAYFPWQGSRR